MALGMIGELVSGAANMAMNAQTLGTNLHMQESQQQFNREEAEKAYQRQRQFYSDFSSPQAMVHQLKEAGLNPALMYGIGSQGGQGASGSQASSGIGSAGSMIPMNLNLAGAQQAAAAAENLNADAELKREEAKRLRGENPAGESEINLRNWQAKTEQEKIGKTKAETALIKANEALTNIERTIKEDGAEYAVNRLKYESWRVREEFREAKVKANVSEQTEQYLTEREELINQKLFNEALRIESETELNQTQAENAWVTMQELVRSNNIKQWIAKKDYEVALKEIQAKLGAAGINAGGSLLGTIIETAVDFIPGASILKRLTKVRNVIPKQ